jgi:RNase P subunit RPR2
MGMVWEALGGIIVVPKKRVAIVTQRASDTTEAKMRITEDMVWDKIRISVAKEPHEMYCSACGTVLMQKPVGSSMFTSERGKCDCGWNCCDAARPTCKTHKAHLAYRKVEA